MKAVYLNQHGNIENLIYSQDFEKPNPKENEVLIKILYTTINRIDLTLRKGYEIDKKSPFTFPKILGSDAVGVIESFGIGKMEEDFKIGDKVLILPYFYLEGNKFNLGINYQGTYAEYISIPIQSIIKLNSNLDIINFAALPTSGLIAYKCLTNFFFNEIDKSAKNLLLIGGNSGVGTFIIQLAKLLNFNIITTIGNPKNTNILKDLGANEIYNHYDDDFKDKLISKHSNYFDLIIDFQGGEYLNLYLELIKQNGEIINIGGIQGKNINLNLQKLYSKNVKLSGKSIYENDGNYDLSKKYILNLVDLIEKNKINTTINNIYNLQEIPKVHQIIENGVYCGKSIIKIY